MIIVQDAGTYQAQQHKSTLPLYQLHQVGAVGQTYTCLRVNVKQFLYTNDNHKSLRAEDDDN